jgi:hypothetical protein
LQECLLHVRLWLLLPVLLLVLLPAFSSKLLLLPHHLPKEPMRLLLVLFEQLS